MSKESAINDVLVSEHCLIKDFESNIHLEREKALMVYMRMEFDSVDTIQQFHLIDKAKYLQLPADFISQLEDDFKIGK